ncbi:MAG: M20 aminoacylase family protein [Pseudomonadales bacterium]
MKPNSEQQQEPVNDNAGMQRWRRHLHRYPETGFDVHDSAAFVAEILRSFGLEVQEGIGQTGVVAILRRGDSSKAIGLRADLDALHVEELNTFEHCSKNTGRMHACGHDGHTAMLLGAAQCLAQNGEFNGTVYFIFQPNEEHGLGAKAMIADGLFQRFPMRAIYGMHNMPGMPSGQLAMNSGAVMAGEDNFCITVKGRGGHASQPHHHIDPVPISAEITLALQTIVSRSIAPEEQAVVSITEIETDGTVNVIPSTVTLKGDCRNFNEDVSLKLEEAMTRIVEGISAAHGADCEVVYQRLFPPTINSQAETEHARLAALATVGSEKIDASCKPLTISEDFASMLKEKPGCYVFIGNGEDSEGGCMLHNPHYDFNDDILDTGCQYWVNLAEQQLK